jgi:hypothetical protein
VKFQEWALEIKRRPVESFGEVESPLIRKKNANEWGTLIVSGTRFNLEQASSASQRNCRPNASSMLATVLPISMRPPGRYK